MPFLLTSSHLEDAKRWLQEALDEITRQDPFSKREVDYTEARRAAERALDSLRRLAPENG